MAGNWCYCSPIHPSHIHNPATGCPPQAVPRTPKEIMSANTSRLTDPWSDEGVLIDAAARIEGALTGLPDVVLIDRLRHRLECAVQRETEAADEPGPMRIMSVTRTQVANMEAIVNRARNVVTPYSAAAVVDEILRELAVAVIEEKP